MDPLAFEPYARPQIWGERRLERQLGKRLPPGNIGEVWEISAHPHHVSRVAEGPLAGSLLTELWHSQLAELLGRERVPPAKFPLLIKFLDCHQQLSVQVHPDDETARELAPGETGKTESWLILSAEPGARIYAGLKHGVTRQELETHLARGTVAECLHSFVPRAGDCLHLPAGTVHAVGGGVLMAEVQQSSDATFRLFDWNHVDAEGRARKLHIEQSLAAINWSAGPVNPLEPKPLGGLPTGIQGEQLARCAYFELRRYRASRSFVLPHEGELSVWLVLEGAAELRCDQSDYRRHFARGNTVLIPASATDLSWTPDTSATLLEVRMP